MMMVEMTVMLNCLLSLGLARSLKTVCALLEASQQFYRELIGGPTFCRWLGRVLETVMLWLCS